MLTGTITRRAENAGKNIFRDLLTREDFMSVIGKLGNSADSAYPAVCAELREMFEAVGIECEAGREVSYYEALAESAEFPVFADAEARILRAMYENFGDYPSPEEYMRRMVDRLSDPADLRDGDTLRVKILKRFIKYGNFLTYKRPAAGKNGKEKLEKVSLYGGELYIKSYVSEKAGKKLSDMSDIIGNIDDDIFGVLANASKAQKRSDGKYGLLKMADDLARGIFRSGGAAKKELYLFAMVFNMTYCADHEKCIKPDSDIQKNLFEDYYTNNLMRFISEAYSGNPGSYELDPSGQGINYKNFAEMICLYYISSDLPPYQKIMRSSEMINRLKNTSKISAAGDDELPATMYYSELITENILKLSENKFEKFIAENYDCSAAYEETDKNGAAYTAVKGVFQLRTSQRTAFEIYNELIQAIENTDSSFTRRNCNYGLWFADVSMFSGKSRKGTEHFCRIIDPDNKEPEKVAEFIKLLCGINMFLGNIFTEKESSTDPEHEYKAPSSVPTRAMNITDPEDMSRTSLITAYYYYYNAINEKKNIRRSFADVYDDYTNSVTGLDSLLEEAHYQPISTANIFDMAVMLSSYAYLLC